MSIIGTITTILFVKNIYKMYFVFRTPLLFVTAPVSREKAQLPWALMVYLTCKEK
jgi:hypothetical protein